MQIFADDKPDRIAAHIIQQKRLGTGLKAGTVAVATIEDLAIEKHNRLAQAMCPNIYNQLVEWLALKQWEEIREGVKC
jgi:hypothetical protein